MARFIIHSTDGGFIPPEQEITVAIDKDVYPGEGLAMDGDINQYKNGAEEPTYVLAQTLKLADYEFNEMFGAAVSIKARAICVTPNIVFKKENGEKVRFN